MTNKLYRFFKLIFTPINYSIKDKVFFSKKANIKITEVPTIKKPIIYLDYNVFVKATKDSSFKKILMAVVNTELYVFPFTHIHIAEINRIEGDDRKENQNARLAVLKEVSKSNYLDYRDHIKSYTIRKRDPFEVFETINEVPKEFIDKVSKYATDLYLRKKIPNLPKECFKTEEQYGYFTKLFRTQFPDLGKALNNMEKSSAIELLEKEVFKMSFEKFFDMLIKTQPQSNNNIQNMGLDFFIDNTLYLAGYRTPMKDVKKPAGLLSDHQHIRFACNCPIIISDDQNIREKIKNHKESSPIFVGDSIKGINFLLIHSGLVNLVSKSNGERVKEEYIKNYLREFN